MVVNKHRDAYDVYIGRGSPWGNPFPVHQVGRERCIQKFEEYFRERLEKEPELLPELMKLKGKRLGCFCAPLPCHGNVLEKIIEENS